MAILGNAYTKTNWGFEERPVSSLKLNAWDDAIEGGLELGFELLREQWGGRDGVVRGGGDELKIVQSSPANMVLKVNAGYALIAGMPHQQAALGTLPSIAAPITHPRIDLVQAKLDGWTIEVKTGVEAAGPVMPTVDPDAMMLAEIRVFPGMTVIQDIEVGLEGYIIDRRSFL